MCKAVVLSWVVTVAVAAGCLAGPEDRPAAKAAKPGDLDRAQRIHLSASSAGGIPGAPLVLYELHLTRDGECKGTVTHGNNVDARDRVVTYYDLPREMFDECLGVVTTTRFLRMKSVEPEHLFENASKGVGLTWDGGSHGVSVILPAEAPRGFDTIFNFAASIETRGKKTKTEGRPERPRTPAPDRPR